MNCKIAALVILYHFNEQNAEIIQEYASQLEKVYCVDNSEIIEEKIAVKLSATPNIEYIGGNGNRGLPVVMNQIAQKAIQEGFSWLITFDQDSRVTDNMIQEMTKFAKTYSKINEVGIISPLINDGKRVFGAPVSEYSFYDKVYQSGAMHNLSIWDKIDGYDEKLFIDQVDYEYCMRLLQNNYKIVKLNKAVLLHNIEDAKTDFIYSKGFRVTIHKYSPLRYYYIIRNNLYCGHKYQFFWKPYYAETRRNRKLLWRTLPWEEQKGKKLQAILCGYLDYFLGRMGKCKWKF